MAIAIVCMLVFAIIIIYQTLATHPPPVMFGKGRIVAWVDKAKDSTIISYTRPVEVYRNVDGVDILRSINCTVNGYRQTWDLQPLVRNYAQGNNQNVNMLVVYPYPVPVGSECEMATMVQWTPTLSIEKHTWMLPKVSFTVGAKPLDVREQ